MILFVCSDKTYWVNIFNRGFNSQLKSAIVFATYFLFMTYLIGACWKNAPRKCFPCKVLHLLWEMNFTLLCIDHGKVIPLYRKLEKFKHGSTRNHLQQQTHESKICHVSWWNWLWTSGKVYVDIRSSLKILNIRENFQWLNIWM